MLPAIGQSTEAAGRSLSNLMQGVPAGSRPMVGMGPGRVQPPTIQRGRTGQPMNPPRTRAFAGGGKVGDLVKAISDALDHLYAGDTASARQSLRGISEPAVVEAAQNLSIPGDRGRALAVKKLEAMVEQISDAEKVPGLKRGGRASKEKC